MDFGELAGALTGESVRADEFIRLIGAYPYQSRRPCTIDNAWLVLVHGRFG